MAQPHDMKQIAYDIWRRCGQNIVETARILKREHHFKVTRQTLASWKVAGDWEGRAARAEAESENLSEICSEQSILLSMSRQVKRYDQYFANLPDGKMDNQAGFAFASLCNGLLTNIRKGYARPGASPVPSPIADVRRIKTPAEAIAALVEAIQAKINMVLADPLAIDLKTVKEMKSAIDFLEDLSSRYKPEDNAAGKGLSDDAADEIRRKILGIRV